MAADNTAQEEEGKAEQPRRVSPGTEARMLAARPGHLKRLRCSTEEVPAAAPALKRLAAGPCGSPSSAAPAPDVAAAASPAVARRKRSRGGGSPSDEDTCAWACGPSAKKHHAS